ncbi:hypothetical protein ACFL0V_04205 [Nanoarchaeota archaeon]
MILNNLITLPRRLRREKGRHVEHAPKELRDLSRLTTVKNTAKLLDRAITLADSHNIPDTMEVIDQLAAGFQEIQEEFQAVDTNATNANTHNKEAITLAKKAKRKAAPINELAKKKEFTPEEIRHLVQLKGEKSHEINALVKGKYLLYRTDIGVQKFKILRYRAGQILIEGLKHPVGLQKHQLDAALSKIAVLTEEKNIILLEDLFTYIDETNQKPDHQIWKDITSKKAKVGNELGTAHIDGYEYRHRLVHFKEFPEHVWVSANSSIQAKKSLQKALQIAPRMHELEKRLKKAKPFQIDTMGKLLHHKTTDQEIAEFPSFGTFTPQDLADLRTILQYFVFNQKSN